MAAELLALVKEIESYEDIFDFARNGNDLGEQLVGIAAAAINDQTEHELDEDGTPFAPLSGGYADWKARVAPGAPIGYLWGHMRTFDQMLGLYSIRSASIDQTYGVDDMARNLAVWFQEGNSRQPARRFYAFNSFALAAMDQFLENHFADAIG